MGLDVNRLWCLRRLWGWGLVGVLLLSACGEGGPLTVRYEAERALWKARQLERRINSQPEAAQPQAEQASIAYRRVLDDFPLEAVAADSAELQLLGQVRGSAALGLSRMRIIFLSDSTGAIDALHEVRRQAPWDVPVTARVYAELLKLNRDFGSPDAIVGLLDEVVEILPPVDPDGEPLPLVLEAPTQKAEILDAIGKGSEAKAELEVAHVFYDDIAKEHRGTTAEVAALLQKANAFILQGRPADADAVLTQARQAEAAESMIPSIMESQANMRLQVGKDPLGAAELFLELHRDYAGDARSGGALMQAAIALRAAGLIDSALATFDKVQDLYMHDINLVSQSQFLQAKVYETQGRTEEAVRRYRSVANQFPRTQSGLLAPKELANLYETDQNPAAARAELLRAAGEYRRIIDDAAGDPTQSGLHLSTLDHLVDVWVRLERWEDAVNTLIERAEQYPRDRRSPFAYLQAANIRGQELEDPAGAVAILERLRSRYPDLPISSQASQLIEQLKDPSGS